ncbi:MAG: polyprenyl synthetase family protein [Planctomycetaceae bacterium]|jgi:geranylgeranyl pyrophosphate synthase|nr:polyprenyl synthetase family protein [Planctomycetaceae bacterium]
MAENIPLSRIEEQTVPHTPEDRSRLLVRLQEKAADLPKNRLLSRRLLEEITQNVLRELHLPETLLAWGMVFLGNFHGKPQVTAIPYSKRALLLPHCMRNKEVCPAKYDSSGLECRKCGACDLTELTVLAEQLGYRKILIAEGTPVVVQWILNGEADAILGIGCLQSLERAFEKIQWVGIPAMAVPLNFGTCVDTKVEMSLAREMIETRYVPGNAELRGHLALLRGTADMFRGPAFTQLLPRKRSEHSRFLPEMDPIQVTETLGFDYLTRGGKCFRPFVTLAVYDAMKPSASFDEIPDAVKRVAMAIEIFHKASLIHDDIEDDDPYRYGEPSLHRQFGVSTAINTGDYLLGLGYRLIAEQRNALGSGPVADILWKLGDAHAKLSEGQGAELAWRSSRVKKLEPIDVMKIYALKTSPAFEAALYAGLRMSDKTLPHVNDALAGYARAIGVAFQIKNDLADWEIHEENKRTSGGDVLGKRPTLLLALALKSLPEPEQRELLRWMETLAEAEEKRQIQGQQAVRELYVRANVFEQAGQLITKYALRADETAESISEEPLRLILFHLTDMILH